MVINTLNSAVAITRILDALAEEGLSVFTSSNFKKLEKQVSKLKNKSLTAQFKLANFELYEQNAFWVGIRNKEGRLVSIHCSRTLDLGRGTLAAHWAMEQERLYKKPAKVGKNHCPLAYELTGNLSYHGDFWVDDSLKGGANVGPMVFLVFLLCQQRYDPDWIYGRMADKLATEKGFVQRCGFSHAQPYGTDWRVEPTDKGVNRSNWLCAVNREGIHHQARIIVQNGLEFLQRS